MMQFDEDPDEINSARIKKTIEKAYEIANNYWRSTEVNERVERLRNLGRTIQDMADDICGVLAKELGKPAVEIYGDEISVLLSVIDYCVKNAQSILESDISRTLTQKLMLPGRKLKIYREPLGSGIVNVISPWNNPFQIPLSDCVEVLASGNIPILKPSEKTPGVNALIAKVIKQAGLENLFFIIEGGPETAREIIRALPSESHVAFTGSSRIGDFVKEACDERGLYAHIEGGGSDHILVFIKQDSSEKFLERAANAAVAARFRNRGQNCNAGKALVVVSEDESVANSFAREIARKASLLKRGSDMGNIFGSEQLWLAKEQLEDAADKGAEFFTHNYDEAMRTEDYFPPIVLWKIKSDMKVVREETFCPILPIYWLRDENDAIDLVNKCAYGLDAYIFTEDFKKGHAIGKKLTVGSYCLNDVIVNYAFPSLPFGGEGKSGGSRRHGPDGILKYTRPKSVLVAKKMLAEEPHWFPYEGKAKPLPFKKEKLLRWAVKNLFNFK